MLLLAAQTGAGVGQSISETSVPAGFWHKAIAIVSLEMLERKPGKTEFLVAIDPSDRNTVAQTQKVLKERLETAGIDVLSVHSVGGHLLAIDIPATDQTDQIEKIVTTPARLSFHTAHGRTDDPGADIRPGRKILPEAGWPDSFIIVEAGPILTGAHIVEARATIDQNGRPALTFRFDDVGTRRFGEYTAAHIGDTFAIILDGRVLSAPIIQAPLHAGSGMITGNMTLEETTRLAALLEAGTLPARIELLSTTTYGPVKPQGASPARRIGAIGTIAITAAGLLLHHAGPVLRPVLMPGRLNP